MSGLEDHIDRQLQKRDKIRRKKENFFKFLTSLCTFEFENIILMTGSELQGKTNFETHTA